MHINNMNERDKNFWPVVKFKQKYNMLPSDYYEKKYGKTLIETESGHLLMLESIEIETLNRLIKQRDVNLKYFMKDEKKGTNSKKA